MELFAEHSAVLVACDAVAFRDAQGAVERTSGRPGACRHRIPLRVADRLLGHLTFSRRHPFGAREIRTLDAMGADLARPLDNTLRYLAAREAATRDPLTGAANRRHLEHALEREVSLVRRHGGSLALLMIDIDRFKQINDRFGHPGGDRCLMAVAACIAGCVRISDTLFRYGGEEFCVLLPRTRARGAARVGERVRRAVGALRIPAGAETIRLSVSLGVASFAPGDSAAALLGKADAALYLAKGSGRNTVCSPAAGQLGLDFVDFPFQVVD